MKMQDRARVGRRRRKFDSLSIRNAAVRLLGEPLDGRPENTAIRGAKESDMSDSHGNFIWYELATNDVGAAATFYKDVIGWGAETWQGAVPYTRWMADDTAVGGAAALSDEARKAGATPHWFGYVLVDDVDALTKRAVSLGGKAVVPPTDIPEVGRFSMIADPHGATIAVLKPTSGPAYTPPPAETPYRRVSWHELIAGEREAALRFYAQLFGWEKTEAVESPMGTYQMYGKGGRTLGGMMTKPAGYPYPPHWLYYVKVPDLDAALARVKKDGGKVMNGPMVVPGGDRVAQCLDPQGAQFALHGK
jgi:predicted enzyme related to lactoylglutathione lyase